MGKNPALISNESPNEVLFWRSPVSHLPADSLIVVRSTDCAIFEKGGVLLDILEAGEHSIFDKKHRLFCDVKTGFNSVEIIYMSKTAKLNVLWGTPRQFDFTDPVYDVAVKVGASGEFEVQIDNPRKFYLELVGREKNFTLEKLKERLLGRMMNIIEPEIARVMSEKTLSFDTLTQNKQMMADAIFPVLNKMFVNEYGLRMFSYTLSKILIPDEYIGEILTKKKKIEDRKEAEQDKIRMKEEAKEIAKELEKLSGNEFQRNLVLKNLESTDYQKYLEVMKVMGYSGGNGQSQHRQRCPECGTPGIEGQRYCGSCGASYLKAVKACSRCHTQNGADSNYCKHCGEKL